MIGCLERPRVLAIGSHPDDLELGAGGFLYRLIRERRAEVTFVVLTPGENRIRRGTRFPKNQRVEETRRAAEVLGVPAERIDVLGFRDGELHKYLHELISELEERLDEGFDLVLTHASVDTHSDHSTAYQATVAAARSFDGTVLAYQSVSSVPNMFRPTLFITLDEESIAAKQRALECHVSQREKAFMQRVHTEGMARGWAVFLRRPTEFLEAFEVHKAFWWRRSPDANQ